MQPPAVLLKRGINALPTMGDGRQSGTSGSPSILNISPEAVVGGGLALLKNGDPISIDLNKRRVDVLIPEAELAARRAAWTPPVLDNKTPWEEIYRSVPGAGDAVYRHHRAARGVPQQPLTVCRQIQNSV
jgi:dihydroxy-acid dehydratase